MKVRRLGGRGGGVEGRSGLPYASPLSTKTASLSAAARFFRSSCANSSSASIASFSCLTRSSCSCAILFRFCGVFSVGSGAVVGAGAGSLMSWSIAVRYRCCAGGGVCALLAAQRLPAASEAPQGGVAVALRGLRALRRLARSSEGAKIEAWRQMSFRGLLVGDWTRDCCRGPVEYGAARCQLRSFAASVCGACTHANF